MSKNLLCVVGRLALITFESRQKEIKNIVHPVPVIAQNITSPFQV